MGELTSDTPKPMLQVQGKPILEHIVTGTLAAGAESIHIITGWKADIIEGYFQDGSPWNTSITYSRQVVQNGTGKAPELAKDFVGDDCFLLTYGDILVRKSVYRGMVDRFFSCNYAALFTVVKCEDVSKGGLCFFDEDLCLTHMEEKPNAERVRALKNKGWIKDGDPLYYNAGVYLFRPTLFDYTAKLEKSPRGEYELTDALESMVKAKDRISGHVIDGFWADVRDPGVLAKLAAETSWD